MRKRLIYKGKDRRSVKCYTKSGISYIIHTYSGTKRRLSLNGFISDWMGLERSRQVIRIPVALMKYFFQL
jgi:hypothetical protein